MKPLSEQRGTYSVVESGVYYHNEQRSYKLVFPFNDIYWKLINSLKSRGYNTCENSFYNERYKILRKYNYKAEKGDVWLLFNKYPNGFKVEIGLKQNYMITSDSFWPKYHDNYKEPMYLEKKTIELVIKHLSDFLLTVENIKKLDSNPKDPIQNLFYEEKINNHVHGGAQNFSQLKAYCEKKLSKYDKSDANGFALECGQIKYFYSSAHGNRLCRAEVWHNINNMWWALINGSLYNEASFRFRDYNPELPKKNPEHAIDKVERLIHKFSKEMNFEKCIALRNHLQILKQNLSLFANM